MGIASIRVTLLFVFLSISAGAQTWPGNPTRSGAAAPTQPSDWMPPASANIRVDAFGYRPPDAKVAILRRPVNGHDAPSTYAPGPQLEVRRLPGMQIVLTGAPVAWKAGAVHDQSGDRAWWFDFTAVSQPGVHRIVDPANSHWSEEFRIGADVYAEVLVQATRTYLYQRCGTPKLAVHAEPAWADAACHLGASQDLDCRFVLDTRPATSRNLVGGWHDAGDYNKYVNFADDALHELLDAYEVAPALWTDAHGIPESGNTIADLLDEVRWELEWLLRMQNGDGSVIHKVSVLGFSSASPPSADLAPRFYSSATASATISAAGAFAHAAQVFGQLADAGSQAFSVVLRDASLDAWNWLEANPGASPSAYDNDGGAFSSASAEDSAYSQEMNRLRAAAWLFRLTGDVTYRGWFDAHYQDAHLFQWFWASPWEFQAQSALLTYAQTPAATPAVVQDYLQTYGGLVSGPAHLGQFTAATDPYRSFLPSGDYVWGSNRTKALQAHMLFSMNRLGLDATNAAAYEEAGQGYVHTMHGVNPAGFTYLTNLGASGAPASVTELYHGWFADGTVWDSSLLSPYGPAPGFVPGGPNPGYAPDPSYSGPPIEPPMNQPILKSYRDWNGNWPENSWEVTENHIPYQSAYVRMLAEMLSM